MKLLQIFFLISLCASVILILVGVACLLSPDTWESFLVDNLKDEVGEDNKDIIEEIDKVSNVAYVVGGVAVGCGALLVFGLLCCCYLMGIYNFISV